MPIARFEMPDGRIARFEVAEGTTPEQAQAMIAEQIATVPGLFLVEYLTRDPSGFFLKAYSSL